MNNENELLSLTIPIVNEKSERVNLSIDLDKQKFIKGHEIFNKITSQKKFFVPIPNTYTPEDYIRRWCPLLKIDKKNQERAIFISNKCCDMGLAFEHGYCLIAALAVFIMAQENKLDINGEEICDLFGIRISTLNKLYNIVAPHIDKIINTTE